MSDPKAVAIWSKVEGIDELAELALNLHWSWDHAAGELWECLDPELWETTQNPWVILQTVQKIRFKPRWQHRSFVSVSTICFARTEGLIPQTHGSRRSTRVPRSHWGGPALVSMTACTSCTKAPGVAQIYLAVVPATRPASDYTPRVIPHHPHASVPLEANEILRQR
jgi:hypothetical protein